MTGPAAGAMATWQQQQPLPTAAECGIITYAAVRHVVECAVAPSKRMMVAAGDEGRDGGAAAGEGTTFSERQRRPSPVHPIDDEVSGRNGLFVFEGAYSSFLGTGYRLRRNSAKSQSAHTAASSAAMNVGRTGSLRLVAFADHQPPAQAHEASPGGSSGALGGGSTSTGAAPGNVGVAAVAPVASSSTTDAAGTHDEEHGGPAPDTDSGEPLLADGLAHRAASVKAPFARVQQLLAPAFGPPTESVASAASAIGVSRARRKPHPSNDQWPRPRSLVSDHGVAPGANLHQLRSRLASLRVS
jgi:hypothetical protein